MKGLAQRALLGIARAPRGDDDVPPDLRALAAGASDEEALLWTAGASAVYRLAGHAPRTGVMAPAPCDDDPATHCDRAQRWLVEGAWDDPPLLAAVGARLAAAGLVLTPALLPRALDLSPARRGALAAVLGPRGRWLAAQRPRWRWALGEPDDPEALARTLEEGTVRAARVEAAHRLRAYDPPRARELIAAGWKGEQADARAALVGALETELSVDDEGFLEACLRDRAGAVRRGAQALLSRLPSSAFSARMAARAATLVTRRPAPAQPPRSPALNRLARLLGRDGAGPRWRLVLTPPPELPEDWRADGIDGTAPGTARRTPTAWACQVLTLTPLAAWLPLDLSDPAAVVGALPSDEPGLALALAEGVARAGVRPLARPLGRWLAIHDKAETREFEAALARLTPVMEPLADGELTALLGRRDALVRTRYGQTLGLAPRPWSLPLARAFVEAVFDWLRAGERLDGAADHPFLTDAFEDAPLALPEPLVVPLVDTLSGALARSIGQRQRALERFTTRLRLRARLTAEIPL